MHSGPIQFRIALISALAAFAACTTAGAPKSADSANASAGTSAISPRDRAIRDSVKIMLDGFTAKMNTKDFAGVGEYYSNDSSFFWVEGGSLRYRSADEVRAGLKSLESIPEIELKYYETKIDVLSPTVASVRTEFSQTFKEGVGKGTTFGGYLTIVVVREADGWKMRSGHTSSRFPRPGM